MKQYIKAEVSKTFRQKTKAAQKLINTTLHILESFGIPTDGSPRRLERMAIAFLACANVNKISDLPGAKDLNSGHALKTRDIITYVNKHFKEHISSGSYDDIRRKDLKLLTVAGVVVQSSPESATNDSTRGYSVSPIYADLLRSYGGPTWESEVVKRLEGVQPLAVKLQRERNLPRVNVQLPSGKKLKFSTGLHNDLQKAVIEEFLPRYGAGAEVLYVGDTSDKYLHLDKRRLAELNFFEVSHEELPDVIAYSKDKNWLYLIEAVHSSGPISEIRLMELQRLTKNCKTELVYITAFLDRSTFRRFIAEVAWETEVWIAADPDHMVHFNGDKFLGPYMK